MPIAQPDLARTLLGVPVVVAVLSNDEGAGLDVVGYTRPAAGTLALNPDQSFTFTPAPGFEGTDSFTYNVRDAAGGTAEGEVRIVVARPNAAPVARSDSAQLTAGGDVAMAVLANDNDLDGDALALLGIDAPGHGTIRVEAGQTIRYTPQRGFSGIDSFTYTVGDGRGGVSMATVTVVVVNPNTPPVAAADAVSTVAGTPVTVDVVANDDDPDGDRVELAGFSFPGHGTLNLTPERRVVYTPAAGFVGADSFTYTVADAHGATAEGVVRVEVERRNAPPVAMADSVSTSGEPVTLDLLANDNDPDGDPLRLTALTLPVRGRIAVNPSGTVTYTPPQGFSGIDSFTYRVTDGTAEAEAEITVAVTAPQVPTYANGYRYRRRLVVPPQAARAETATDFVLLVREQGDWLRPAASGGRVESEVGHDLRFELENGTKLDHELERYDATVGSVLAWVRVPGWELSNQLRLVLYYGKPGLAATEANPGSVWRGYLAVLDARTGADRSGNNRALTPTGVVAGMLLGDAGGYTGTSIASRADATFLSGLNALTVQALVRPDAAMVGSSHGILAQGPMNGTDTAAGVTLQYLATTADGTRNAIHFKVACDDGGAFVMSGADAHRSQRQLLHGLWRQGDTARLFLDGVELQPSSASVARSGLTAMPTGGLYLGAGARDPATGGWSGLIDEVRFAATALTPARIASEARNLGGTQGLYGLGGEDAAEQSDAAPVAVPLAVQTLAGSSIDIDVAARAYDPDGPGLPEVAAAGAATDGVVTVVSGKVRYTPFAGHVGADQFTYTLDNAGKRSTSTVFMTVAAPTDVPVALRTISVTSASQLTAALAGNFTGLTTLPAGSTGPLRPGDHISCAAGTYAGTFTMAVAGTRANPIFIRSAAGADTVTFTGQIAARGAWCGVQGGRFTGNGRKVDIGAAGGRVTRCLFDGVAYDGMVYLTGNSHPEVRVDRNEFRNIAGSAVRSEINDGLDHQNMRIDHNYFNGHVPVHGFETPICAYAAMGIRPS